MPQKTSNITSKVLTKNKWMIWTPIGRWYFDTDPESEKKMKDKYAELLARYPKMEIEKHYLKPGERIW